MQTNPKKTERAISIQILNEITEEGAYANIALRKTLQEETHLEPRSRAFITELVNETLRNLLLIDHIINAFSKNPVEKMKPFIKNLLRISVCQIRLMEKIPDRAAVNEAVILAKAYGFTNLSGFVNGILRNISREPEKPVIPESNSAKNIALKYSYPKWVVKNLIRWLGEDLTLEFCKNSHNPPPVTVHINTLKTNAEKLTTELEQDGIEVKPLNPPFLALKNTGDMSQIKAFKKGHFFVMDPGAYLAVEALEIKPNQTLIDLCAAPGGKSFAAACQMENMGKILAYDLHEHRKELIRQTSRKLGFSILESAEKDALIYDEKLNSSADVVLLDAPCSGFGTIRKHSEIKYTRTRADIFDLAEKQGKMLENAAMYVKTGGRLVYSTCTVTKEENIDNIELFLEKHKNFKLEKTIQTLPSSNSDGFFAATLVKQI